MYKRLNKKWFIRKREVSKYICIYLPEHPFSRSDGSMLEHRVILENKLGRILTPKEVVHHIDGNGLNNSPNNLELLTKEQHDKHPHKNYRGWFLKGRTPYNKTFTRKRCLGCRDFFQLPPRGFKKRKTCSHKCKWIYLRKTRYSI